MCLKDLVFFQNVGRFYLCFLRFKNIEERCMANLLMASLLSVVSKIFEKLVNNWLNDHLVKFGLFSNFQCGSRSFHSTADLL